MTAEAPLLETNSVSRGGVITGRTLVDLPRNGRNAFALAALEPGVNLTPQGTANTFFRTTGNGGISSATFGGGGFRSNESFLDGVPNTGTDGVRPASTRPPNTNAEEEFAERRHRAAGRTLWAFITTAWRIRNIGSVSHASSKDDHCRLLACAESQAGHKENGPQPPLSPRRPQAPASNSFHLPGQRPRRQRKLPAM